MHGEFCHHCGQSIHSVLKPMHHMVEDTLDMVLHVDGRIVHTLPPLLLKPGFLTLEYFSGRRQRYVAPFRLMFVLCLLSFFLLHLAVDWAAAKADANTAAAVARATNDFAHADDAGEVRDVLREKTDELEKQRATARARTAELDATEMQLRTQANQRLHDLGAAPLPLPTGLAPAAAASTASPPAAKAENKHQPVNINVAWLPDIANARLSLMMTHVVDNMRAARRGDTEARRQARERMIGGIFAVLPQTMFVLIPVFALLLKLFYVFRRRLYMEHLIVALHSHAFLFLNLLLIALVGMLSTWLKPHAAWTGYLFGWIQAALLLWQPVYLLLMQKRIYRQGWLLTLVKYWFIGWFYLWLLGFTLTVAFVLGLAH
ncbi:hypothetical protein ASG87_10625 [Frateuria sp. Soil773]|nr:hypothetical protein ASG87_10625 [Frateuria sp. Soil773]